MARSGYATDVDASTVFGRTGHTEPIEISTGLTGGDAEDVPDTVGSFTGRDRDAGGPDQTVGDGMVRSTGADSGTGMSATAGIL